MMKTYFDFASNDITHFQDMTRLNKCCAKNSFLGNTLLQLSDILQFNFTCGYIRNVYFGYSKTNSVIRNDNACT